MVDVTMGQALAWAEQVRQRGERQSENEERAECWPFYEGDPPLRRLTPK